MRWKVVLPHVICRSRILLFNLCWESNIQMPTACLLPAVFAAMAAAMAAPAWAGTEWLEDTTIAFPPFHRHHLHLHHHISDPSTFLLQLYSRWWLIYLYIGQLSVFCWRLQSSKPATPARVPAEWQRRRNLQWVIERSDSLKPPLFCHWASFPSFT